MIVPVMAISNLVLTQQIYSEETNGAHAHYREPVPLNSIRGFPDASKGWKIRLTRTKVLKYLHVGRRKIQISPPLGEQDQSNALPQGQQRQSNPHPMLTFRQLTRTECKK